MGGGKEEIIRFVQTTKDSERERERRSSQGNFEDKNALKRERERY